MAAALRPYEERGFVVRLQDGGMRPLLDVPSEREEINMAGLAREAGRGVQALTAWRKGQPGRGSLLLGFTNIWNQAEAERQVARLMHLLCYPIPFWTQSHLCPGKAWLRLHQASLVHPEGKTLGRDSSVCPGHLLPF